MVAPVVGYVDEVWRHPVKSMQGESLSESEVGAHGLSGDRMYGVRDGLTGRVMSAKREPRLLMASAGYVGAEVVVRLPDGAQHAVEDPALDVALTEWLGRPVVVVAATLVRPSGDPFMDDAAVHLLTDAALRVMAGRHPGGDWSQRRFRANILCRASDEGCPDGSCPEDDWVGRQVSAGDAVFAVAQRTIRCPMTSMAQPGLAADPAILDTTAALADKRLGVYADVVRPGRIAVGDEMRFG